MRKSSGKDSGRSFDSVPADDNFRHYMSRKIELQRKQFGLVLPPPPSDESPPKSPVEKNFSLSKDDSMGSCGSYSDDRPQLSSSNASSPRKSVRFHSELEQTFVPTSVSDVLENLKQKHTKKSSLRRRRYGKSKQSQRVDVESHSYSSVQGVLDRLQRRHDKSLKRKRAESVLKTCSSAEEPPRSSDEGASKFASASRVIGLDFVDQAERNKLTSQSTPQLVQHQTESPISSGAMPLTQIDSSSPDIDIDTFNNKRDEPDASDGLQVEYIEEVTPNGSPRSSVASNRQDYFTRAGAPNDTNYAVDFQQQPDEFAPDNNFESNDPGSHSEEQQQHKDKFVSSPLPCSIGTPASCTALSQDANPIRVQKRHRSDLFFSGIVVLINGHTNPDATTLMRLLHKHGGDLEKYETRRVTHIIAERLSTAKANIYKKQQKPTPVCRPEWITESVEKRELLPFGDYLLQDVMEAKAPGTKSLKSFFGAGATSVDKSESEANRWADTDPSKCKYHLNGQVRTVGNDPNFLESYFSNSRLSYIGSFKQRVKSAGPTVTQKPKAGSKRFVLLIDMDCFFAAVALKRYPQYKNSPVAVGHCPTVELKSTDITLAKSLSPLKVPNNSSSELSTCNYIARKFGVRKGMFLGDAIKLCPELVVLPYDFPQYESVSSNVSEQLHSIAEKFNGCVEQVSCDESYVEINICPNDFVEHVLDDFLKSLVEQIRTDIFEATECTASIGVGCNKFLAKLAADKVKPNASFIVHDHQELLDGLSLRDLHGIGRKIERKLQTHGLSTVNDIWDLGDDAQHTLKDIVGGATAQKIVQFSKGIDERPVQPHMRKTIGAECNYGVRFDGQYGPDYMIKGLSREVEKRMQSVAVRGSKLTLKIMKSRDPTKIPGKFLGHGLCDSLSKSVDIPLTQSSDIICSAALRVYEKMGVDKDSIRGMGVVISSLESETPNASSPSKMFSWLKYGPNKSENEVKLDIVDLIQEKTEDTDVPSVHKNAAASMPTYSQLDPDVLNELPDDILNEVQSMYCRNNVETPPRRTATRAKRASKAEKHITIPGQVSVKRMLKLASVKSGEDTLECDNPDFTLSQLDCLPLETQLQIANRDHVTVSKPATKHKLAVHRSRVVNSMDEESDSEQSNNMSTEMIDAVHRSRGFYHENILPLKEFIESTPHPDNDDIKLVAEFLHLCIDEDRMEDAVVFLRTIKTMNAWDVSCYQRLKENFVNKVYDSNGYMLDTVWHGL